RVTRQPKPVHFFFVLLAGVLLVGAGIGWVATQNPNFYFLPAHAPGKWIIYPSPATAGGTWNLKLSTQFRRSFFLETIPRTSESCALSIYAFKLCKVVINGKEL